MLDAIVISDIHLGSDNCEAKALVHFLESIRDQKILTQKLILNGDVFDSIDFRRLRKQHWKVLSTLRKLSDEIEILWINGNHDGPAEIISHLIGIDVRDEVILDSSDQTDHAPYTAIASMSLSSDTLSRANLPMGCTDFCNGSIRLTRSPDKLNRRVNYFCAVYRRFKTAPLSMPRNIPATRFAVGIRMFPSQ